MIARDTQLPWFALNPSGSHSTHNAHRHRLFHFIHQSSLLYYI